MASVVIVAAVFLLRWAIIAWTQVYLTRRGDEALTGPKWIGAAWQRSDEGNRKDPQPMPSDSIRKPVPPADTELG